MQPEPLNSSITRRQLIASAAASCVGVPAWAQGAEWPTRPIRLIVSSSAGSSTDIVARLMTVQLAKTFGQPFVVDNKPGATGIIGNNAVAKAAADGYTLLLTYSASLVINQTLQPKMPYDLFKDLQPIVQFGAGGGLLVVAADFPARNIQEFVALVKANPDKYAYASWGVGSGGHLAMEILKKPAGLRINHVPYKGNPQIMSDLVGGQISIAFADPTVSLPFIRTGKIRALVSATTQRAPSLPDVPSMREAGYQFDVDQWFGMLAPAGTPMPIIQRLNAEVNRIVMQPEIQKQLATLGFRTPPSKTVEQFAQTLQHDVQVWGAVIKAHNIHPE